MKYLPLPNTYKLTQHSSSHMVRYIEIDCASLIASFALDLLHCMFVLCRYQIQKLSLDLLVIVKI